jgi:hypothetical protein
VFVVEPSNSQPRCSTESSPRATVGRFRVCPACGGELIEIRAKLQCNRCHTICETCCEGGRG